MVNAILSPRIEHMFGVPVAVWTGTFFCFMSFACAIILAGVIAASELTSSKSVTVEPSSFLTSSPTSDESLDSHVVDNITFQNNSNNSIHNGASHFPSLNSTQPRLPAVSETHDGAYNRPIFNDENIEQISETTPLLKTNSIVATSSTIPSSLTTPSKPQLTSSSSSAASVGAEV